MSITQTNQRRAYPGWTNSFVKAFFIFGATLSVQVVPAEATMILRTDSIAEDQMASALLSQTEQAAPDISASPFSGKPSMSTQKVPIHTGRAIYYIPRNYIYYTDPSYPILRITYPGFKPLSEDTIWCLKQNLAKVPPGCFPLELRIHGGSAPGPGERVFTNKEMLQNSLKSLKHKKFEGPYGYTIYEVGPPGNEIRTYVKPDGMDIIYVECYGANPLSTCDDYTMLKDKNFIRFFIAESRINEVQDIVSRTRKLFDQFAHQGE